MTNADPKTVSSFGDGWADRDQGMMGDAEHAFLFETHLYNRFDNRPFWYALVWRVSDVSRRAISRLPVSAKSAVTDLIAALVYLPLARLAAVAERLELKVDGWLLSICRGTSFSTRRTDSRDRFGTLLEQRFTMAEIAAMIEAAGLEDIRFSDRFPFWCAMSRKCRDAA